MAREKQTPSLPISLLPIIIMIIALSVGVGFLKLRIEPIIIFSTFIAGLIAWKLGYNWVELQDAIIEKISKSMPALLVLWCVGLLIGAWMFSGTIGMLIYYGIQLISPKFLLVTSFVIAALVSICTGSSWGSVGTIGVALIGIAHGLGVSLPATAGAIVSGAFLGDKLSPLSDTTNLAPIAAGSTLYEHIFHMLYTTIPPAIICLIVYTIVGLNTKDFSASPEQVSMMTQQLKEIFHFNFILFLPVIIVLLGSIMRWPTIPIMLASTLLALILGITMQDFALRDGLTSLISGFNLNMSHFTGTPIEDVMKLMNRGGLDSVNETTMLVFASMAFAGIVSKAGMLDVVLQFILKGVKGTLGLIVSTILSTFSVAFITGNSYLSILIPGELFKDAFIKRGLHSKNLSRTLEDSGTVIVPLIPWSAAGAYMAVTLGVPTLEYLPWAILNYTGIFFAILWAATGFGIAKIKK